MAGQVTAEAEEAAPRIRYPRSGSFDERDVCKRAYPRASFLVDCSGLRQADMQ